MRVEGGGAPAARVPPRAGFGRALARAGGGAGRPIGAAATATARGTGRAVDASRAAAARGWLATLDRRRAGAEEGRERLGARRQEHEAEGAAGAELPRAVAAAAPPRPEVADGAGPLLGPAALARLTVELARAGPRAAVELGFGRELAICLTRAPDGVHLELRAGEGARAAAAAELPRLVAALRARGVRLTQAGVRAGTPARGAALTSRRASDTTASQPGGTVAKW